ncbi:SDR family NAD(P)-dependent oxidoreductase [Methylocaldum gracile]|uniref:SDR family NAD(P)-dependent oxidoreductase n=1 Tax=Methylocaldum sp. 0917 TaxID=2485163 RepID=UPI003DA0E2BA
MTDLAKYIFSEVKQKRLSKEDAIALIRQLKGSAKPHRLHPLLHCNTSTLDAQRFSSVFDGEEVFFREHRVGGVKTLPGVAYLEMARAAAARSTDAAVSALEEVVWRAPLVVTAAPCRVTLELHPEGAQRIAYEIRTEATDSGDRVVHGQGRLVVGPVAAPPPPLALDAIQQRCPGEIDGDSCYRQLAAQGLEYGAGFRGLARVSYGPGEALAELRLPDSADGSLDEGLPLGLLDAALQGTLGLALAEAGPRAQGPMLPFSVRRVRLYGPLRSPAYAHIRYSRGHGADAKVVQYDIAISDATGRIAVALEQFTALAAPMAEARPRGVVYARPRWLDQAGAAAAPAGPAPRLIVADAAQAEALQGAFGDAEVLVLAAEGGLAEQARTAFLHLFDRLQPVLKEKGAALRPVLVLSRRSDRLRVAALAGLLKTAHLENPAVCGKLVEYPDTVAPAQLLDWVSREIASPAAGIERIRYGEDGRREVRVLEPVSLPAAGGGPIKAGGVYWITGGLGGLGLLFARHLGRQPGVKLILSGRSAQEAATGPLLAQLGEAGLAAEYWPCDVGARDEVERLVKTIVQRHGRLDGILHSAGVTQDAFLRNKTPAQIEAVLRAKVAGLVNLDEATADQALDFLVLFSSLSGELGNVGQGDYAGANAFMDAYAEYRQDLVAAGRRRGKTVSLNWPLWQAGGMRVDAASERWLEQRLGLVPLAEAEGLAAFDRALAGEDPQLLIAAGDIAKIRLKLFDTTVNHLSDQSSSATTGHTAGNLEILAGKINDELIKIVSELLKIDINDIHLETNISEYGFDSISYTTFANKINNIYGLELMPTVFFEHPTLASFSEYLTEHYSDKLNAIYLSNNDNPQNIKKTKSEGGPEQREQKRFFPHRFVEANEHDTTIAPNGRSAEPVAIIGMSGRMPGSPDLDAFWRNLEDGRDLISEVPRQRWDWQAYWGDPKTESNKTNIKWGGFIEGVDEFDPLFFNISPVEAELMDPQQRLFMQAVWAAIEHSGHRASDLSGTNTALFVGVANADYMELMREWGIDVNAQTSTGVSHAMLANRVSYLLNIRGPCEPVDTACSSSLVAIHRAVRGIENGDFDMALAGGVNVLLTPTLTISFNKAGMLSEDGRCKTFDKRANGYVRGEGVGVVFLKKLSRALEDNDTIYGVIKSTAQNHGGLANSLTAPNPKAQQDLLLAAYKKAGIDPSTISYIEAHGTGTKLGDPIEINALKAAFAVLYKEHGLKVQAPHCGIGSVKTNIGHLETAAGIAGVLKVLLAINHKKLPGNPHLKENNPYLQLEGSPFYLLEQPQEWNLLTDRENKALPRRAGVSSFGFGGVNAHVVIEEYIDKRPQLIEVEKPHLVVLSAKNAERLKTYAQILLEFLSPTSRSEEKKLADIAYTLQVGREPMEERVVFIVNDESDLIEKLESYCAGNKEIENVYQGKVRRDKWNTGFLTHDEDSKALIDAWLTKRKYKQLAELWVNGFELDWNLLYGDAKPRRISVPTYPFAKEHYWISKKSAGGAAAKSHNVSALLHPLLHRNTSTLDAQRFSSVFDGEEVFFREHRVGGVKTLPGVAYLEMARAAAARSTDAAVSALEEVVWRAPLVVTAAPCRVTLELHPEGAQRIAYEIRTEATDSGDRVVHGQGRLVVGPVAAPPPPLALDAIQQRCPGEIDGDSCYRQLAAQGLEYGAGFRGLARVSYGPGEALAELRLPDSADGSLDEGLPLGLLDAALQGTLGLALAEAGPRAQGPMLPFSVRRVRLYGPLRSPAYAHIRYSRGHGADAKVVQYDIAISDATGRIAVALEQFTALAAPMAEARPRGVVYARPRWLDQAGAAAAPAGPAPRLIVADAAQAEALQGAFGDAEVLVLAAEGGLAEQARTAFLHLFDRLQPVLKEKGAALRPVLVLSRRSDRLRVAALAGLLKTAHLENPAVCGKLVEYPDTVAPAQLLDWVSREIASPAAGIERIRYGEDGRREVRVLEPVSLPAAGGGPIKAGGVYWITGGLGGLGLLFARHLGRQPGVKLILSGRSAQEAATGPLLAQLGEAGLAAEYWPCDVGARDEVERLVKTIVQRHGRLDGILHSAGVTQDAFLRNKTPAQIEAVLRAKVAGLVNLDEATADQALDFLVLFSSLSGELGNVGQGDYAGANAFMDAYAEYRQDLVAAGRRRGKTVSLNWPLWQAGGMRVDAASERWLEQRLGLVPLAEAEGLAAFDRALAGEDPQLLVLSGQEAKIKTLLAAGAERPEPPPVSEAAPSLPAADAAGLDNGAIAYLKRFLSTALKIDLHRIEADAPLEKYGIDSLLIMTLTDQLEKAFGPLSKTLFFEYQTLAELAHYFVQNHRARLTDLLGEPQTGTAPTLAPPAMPIAAVPETGRKRGRFFSPPEKEGAASGRDNAIAIIGLSGKYPRAANLEIFWDNLKSGRDCIEEIPEGRWDHSLYYDADKDRPGKTYGKWGGFLDDVDKFDPLFFNISPREAEFMDPQERLFLETVWETLEDAGYTRESLHRSTARAGRLAGNVGVYVGVMYEEYQLFGAEQSLKGNVMALSGNPASIANRVSYFCNLHGPSLALDTMCSSSLTAIHLACEAIRNGSCEMAIAGGVNVSIHPNKYLALSQGKFISSKGRCESFGEGGDGYIPGEGVGAVLLKPLKQAIEDGDHIYGVIKGTALNHGGKTNGYTVPNPRAQTDVIKRAIEQAGVEPRAISYIEAHGTGTRLGDPIEITGLSQAFESYTTDRQFCAIGSAKSNIGHCESAAGIAGLSKVLLQMKHATLVPSLHSEVLNPHIDFAQTPFVVQHRCEPWQRPVLVSESEAKEYPRLAGVSSFGAGGSNAHVIVEEYRPDGEASFPAEAVEPGAPVLIPLSARNAERLTAYAERLLQFIDRELPNGDALRRSFFNLAYTLQVGREAMEHRVVFVVHEPWELKDKLKAFISGETHIAGCFQGNAKKRGDALAGDTVTVETRQAPSAGESYGKLYELAARWAQGEGVNWNILYEGKKPRRISAPTYPFTRKRYWFDSYRPESQTPRTAATTEPVFTTRASDWQSVWDADPIKTINSYEGREVRLDIVEDGIALITMEDKSCKNMFSEALIAGLHKRFLEVRQNKNIKTLVLTGYDNVFCMGGTKNSLLDIAENRASFTDVPFLYRGLLEFDIPVISAMQGHAFGGGLLFGLYGDIVLMAEEGVYTANFMEYGFTPGMGATYILGEKLGINLATEMMYTAGKFSGHELGERGAAVIIRSKDEVLKEALQIARQLSLKPRNALQVLKRELSGRILKELLRHIDREVQMHGETFSGENVKRQIERRFGHSKANSQLAVAPTATSTYSGKIKLTSVDLIANQAKKPSENISPAETPKVGLVKLPTSSGFKVPVESSTGSNSVHRQIVAAHKRDDVKEQLKKILQKILHVPEGEIDGQETFQELGVDSISGVEIIRDVKKAFGMDLEAAALYDHYNCDKLSLFIEEKLNGAEQFEARPASISNADTFIPEEDLSEDSKRISVVASSDDGVSVLSLQEDIKKELRLILGRTLHLSEGELDDEETFQDLGVDSIGGVEITRDIRKAFDLDLDAASLYDYYNINKLSLFIARKLQDRVGSPGVGESTENNNRESLVTREINIPSGAGGKYPADAISSKSSGPVEEAIKKALKRLLKNILHLEENEIDEEATFQELGVDSISGVEIIRDVKKAFGMDLEAAALYDHYDLNRLASFIGESLRRQETSIPWNVAAPFSALGPDEAGAGLSRSTEIRPEAAIGSAATVSTLRDESRVDRQVVVPFAPGEDESHEAKPPVSSPRVTDIAVIGISGRFPGAANVNEFWENLIDGRDSTGDVPQGRWDLDKLGSALSGAAEDTGIERGGFLDDIDCFDPLFFNISPQEAEVMDPQQRLFLQESWKALEDAGYSPKALAGRECGVFVGVSQGDYSLRGPVSAHLLIGNTNSMLASRIAYHLDLSGPCMAIDTACSSSLSAIHLGCESLRNGDCELALAGGVHIMTTSRLPLMLNRMGIISPTGKSRTFDAAADGWVISEAVGVIVLKPLAKAIEDKDAIYGVIKGSGVNQSGKTNGVGAPKSTAQSQLQQRVYRKAGINPETISYVEVQGVSSTVGDAIEVSALRDSFSVFTSKEKSCALGTLKPNIGHPLAASGVAATIKILLALRHWKIPPTIHVENINGALGIEKSPFYINTEVRDWSKKKGEVRRAAVNGFGFSGTNCHLVLDEYIEDELPVADSLPTDGESCLIVLSAKNPERLQEIVGNLKSYLTDHRQSQRYPLKNIAYTLQTGREAMNCRLAFIVREWGELVQKLSRFLDGGEVEDCHYSGPNHVRGGTQLSAKDNEMAQAIDKWIEEGRLSKLAQLWVDGVDINWSLLYGSKKLRKVNLPTYPFEKRRCWLEPEAIALKPGSQSSAEREVRDAPDRSPLAIEKGVITIVAALLGLAPEELDPDRVLDEYGFDSFLFMRLVQQLSVDVNPALSPEQLRNCRTVQQIIDALPKPGGEGSLPVSSRPDTSVPLLWPQFPELIRLNQSTEGRPVFWLHSGLGGVEAYQPLAENIQRPFLGIQARGWMTDRAPLHGIQAMAAYYIHIVQKVQPEGPYDLGGYSLGGILAYEMTRQLQELGHRVETIVMLDALDTTVFKNVNLSEKTEAFHAVNIALLSQIGQRPEEIAKTLIHRNDVDIELDEEGFLEQLIGLARERGLNKTKSQLRNLIEQNTKVQYTFKDNGFRILPLSDPKDVTCYYFRNKNGLFLGELEPYYLLPGDTISLDHVNYWKEWERMLAKLHIIDLDFSNHMLMLSENGSRETVNLFCENLYSKKGLSKEFLESFKITTKRIHGTGRALTDEAVQSLAERAFS